MSRPIRTFLELTGVLLDAQFVREEMEAALEGIAEAIGFRTIAKLRSFTKERRPPVKAGSPWRPAHPGHWADVSGQLAGAYDFEVVKLPEGGVSLVLKNGAEYAAALEAHDGYFVLSGVTDPGGLVEQIMRTTVKEVAPGWDIVMTAG